MERMRRIIRMDQRSLDRFRKPPLIDRWLALCLSFSTCLSLFFGTRHENNWICIEMWTEAKEKNRNRNSKQQTKQNFHSLTSIYLHKWPYLICWLILATLYERVNAAAVGHLQHVFTCTFTFATSSLICLGERVHLPLLWVWLWPRVKCSFCCCY